MPYSPKLIAGLRWLLLTIAGLATLAAGFVVEENWRGDRAWDACMRELAAQGARLDFGSFQPAAIRDRDNLFKSPTLALLTDKAGGDAREKLRSELHAFADLQRYRSEDRNFAEVRDGLRRNRQLAVAATDAPARDVLDALSPLHSVLDELRDAARSRPKAALPARATPLEQPSADMDTIFHLTVALAVRAAAEIEMGQVERAQADLFAVERIATALADQPGTLLELLVGLAVQQTAADIITTGCNRHVWTGAQLAELQGLMQLRPLEGVRRALEAERAHVIAIVDARPESPFGQGRQGGWPWWLFHGWAEQNKAHYCRVLEEQMIGPLRAQPGRVPVDLATPGPRQPKAAWWAWRPSGWLAEMALTNLAPIVGRVRETADRLSLSTVICALERYRLENGKLPAGLGELVPRFLAAVPRGTRDGAPVQFSPLPEGGRQLYFVGPNGRDDGGREDDVRVKLPSA